MSSYSRLLVSPEVGDIGPDVRRLLDDLARHRPEGRSAVSGECLPLLDVLETERGLELVLDVPGVSPDGLRVLIKNGVVLIVGEKERPALGEGPASFHLVERDFGRFVRAMRVHTAVDAGRAQARLADGELRLVLPKIKERRGGDYIVAVETVSGLRE